MPIWELVVQIMWYVRCIAHVDVDRRVRCDFLFFHFAIAFEFTLARRSFSGLDFVESDFYVLIHGVTSKRGKEML